MNPYLTRWTAVLFVALFTVLPSLAFGAGGSFDKIEASFQLPQVQGNPFDFAQNDVQVTFTAPDGHAITLPAFFDGGQTWRVRHTPDSAGKYAIASVTLNGKDADPQNLTPKEFTVDGQPHPGFVRIDPTNKMRFAFDDGSVYYPVGYDLAWHQNGSVGPMPPLPQSLERMGKAGVNWTRIWMNHWDGKNLDWLQNARQQPPLGQLSLNVAKTWDAIVEAADANGIHFQMTLQHHGQVSTHADANWQINPWSTANGGWLTSPSQFFTDPKAIALTKAKYHYIIARWGYSPAIMAWEIFNEVENSDPFKTNLNDVSAWHVEMAKFLRQYDSYKHLITTSSRVNEPKLWLAMDYYQSHAYPPDILVSIANLDAQHLPKPYFLGEFGGANSNAAASPEAVIHRGLWGSLMSQSSGAAEYWFWYEVEPRQLLFHYTAAQKFIALSNFPSRSDYLPIQVEVEATSRGPLKFGPGVDWAPSRQTHFTIAPSGKLQGVNGMSAYLQGTSNNHDMFPSGTFDVDYPSAGTFAVHADQVTAQGARLELSVDGGPATSVNVGPVTNAGGPAGGQARGEGDGNARIDVTLSIPVPAGKHTIRMENTGPDWIHIHDFTLNPYASALGVLAKGNSESAVMWIYRRDQTKSVQDKTGISVPGLSGGNYRVVWWDTYQGKIIQESKQSVVENQPLKLDAPAMTTDVAAWIEKQDQGN